ncbi:MULTISPECIES: LysR family transcriptional regulator [unclassified Yoonia]|uniref:LysR family transcriptional regulator n=1 Tax=unclassified Yoonia TaxID=2629118 RepID=UPI002AFE47B0|nr:MULTISPECIES: LysR family transcriptional regulator [unclassified Yoonia]
MKDEPATAGKRLTRSRLRALDAVAEQGSFASAARLLNLSHSAISQQVRELEIAYGIKLFERVRGVLQPTPICLELTDVGTRIREAEQDAARILERRDESGKHRLRVGLGNSMPGIAIAARMITRHPSVSITVESGSHQEILAAVLRREVDVGVLPDIPPDARFRRLVVLSQEVVAIARAGSALAQRGVVSLETLAASPLIFRSKGSSTQKVVDRAFRLARCHPEPRLTADTRDAVYEAVAMGIGIGFMWRHGTYRADAVARLTISDIGPMVEEAVFSLAEERNALTDLFFNAATDYSRSVHPGTGDSCV